MKWNVLMLYVFCSMVFLSCAKNNTQFFEDSMDEGLSVFSDAGNNVMACYINEAAYRTNDRMSYAGWGGRTHYEINVYKSISDTAESVSFSWERIMLVLQKETFTIDDFRKLENKRMLVDGLNDYFMLNGERGKGVVYFHKTTLMESATTGKSGHIAGLFEFSTASSVVKKGRFDHSLESGNLTFY